MGGRDRIFNVLSESQALDTLKPFVRAHIVTFSRKMHVSSCVCFVVSRRRTNAPMLTGATGAGPAQNPIAPLISASTACCRVLNIVLPLPSRRNIDCAYRERVSPPLCGHSWVLQKIALLQTPALKRKAIARGTECR